MHLEIITPETKIFTGEIEAVQLPGLDGLFQILKGHAPIISALGKGNVKVDLSTPYQSEEENELVEVDSKNQKTIHIKINGGVLEMQDNKVILLAE
ncbi:MAG: F0F1 ATP synthase subunit epsilon [Crocinitomicaceae bacterium]